MSNVYKLKVNVKSLAAEAKIIRNEERKYRKRLSELVVKESALGYKLRYRRDNLNDHRRGHLRREARSANLAYAFLRGRAYKDVEPNVRCEDDYKYRLFYKRVTEKINRFAHNETISEDQVKNWMFAS